MEKGELDKSLAEEIRARVLADGGFVKITQSLRRGGAKVRISMRPVVIGGEKKFQAEMDDAGQVRVKNFGPNGAAEGLDEIIAQRGARELHLVTATGDLHVRVTRKGRVLVSRSGRLDRPPAGPRPHDREKKGPLDSFDSSALLRAVGISDGSGAIRASMRGKYDQINEFLRAAEALVADGDGKALDIVDCGCGKAYLTLALREWLVYAKGYSGARVCGIDRREDVIASARAAAARLDASGSAFFIRADLFSDIRAPRPGEAPAGTDEGAASPVLPFRPGMVVSLHACDTATDEALAKAVEWKAPYILSAPCCQHELQKTIASPGNAFAGVMRHGILRERLADILTDAFRAQILRILGYSAQVSEFVSREATARNIMIRAAYSVKPGQARAVSEYLELRDYWNVKPWLETRLAERLAPLLSRYE